jgi:acyl-CoA thioester hydrolase
MRQEIFKNGETLAAVLTVDGAWLDTAIRKLAAPPPEVTTLYERCPKSPEFAWEEAP